jgi:hypothetical protein
MAVMPSEDLATRIRTASRSCPDAVSGQVFRTPAQAFTGALIDQMRVR